MALYLLFLVVSVAIGGSFVVVRRKRKGGAGATS
jgi:hypothetical protein